MLLWLVDIVWLELDVFVGEEFGGHEYKMWKHGKVWSVFNIICAYSLNSFQVLLNVPIIHFNYYNYLKFLLAC